MTVDQISSDFFAIQFTCSKKLLLIRLTTVIGLCIMTVEQISSDFSRYSSDNLKKVKTNLTCCSLDYGVATISRLLKITGLFCKRALYKRLYSAKENFKETTNRSHPICIMTVELIFLTCFARSFFNGCNPAGLH